MGTVLHGSVFEKIGYFDEVDFPQYKGDADYGIRAYNSGYKLVVHPELEIWNDRSNTGFSNDKSLVVFLRSLFSRKSNSNIYRDYLFYKRHGKSILVYYELSRKYFTHIGGFLKWKILGFFGYKRNRRY
jgi:GT2 family glycosyltransferase